MVLVVQPPTPTHTTSHQKPLNRGTAIGVPTIVTLSSSGTYNTSLGHFHRAPCRVHIMGKPIRTQQMAPSRAHKCLMSE